MTKSTRIAGAFMGIVMGLVPAGAALAWDNGWNNNNHFTVPRVVIPQQQQLRITQQEQQQITNNFNCQVLGNNSSSAFCNFRAFNINSASNFVNANPRIRADNRGHGNKHSLGNWLGNW